jgi:AraC-like DNA-binding protein
VTWNGRAWLGVGVLIYWGGVGNTSHHRHAAHQIVVVAEKAGAAVYADLGTETVGPVTKLAIPSGVRHRLRPIDSDTTGLTVYLDVDSALGRDVHSLLAAAQPQEWSEVAARIAESWPIRVGDAVDDQVAARLAVYLGRSHTSSQGNGHAYVREALTLVSGRLPGSLTLTDVATGIGVSPSHLSRLWRSELGLSFNTWVRWVRLREVARLVGQGDSITDAAHGAGFADGAHASRVCRDMFGLSPRELARGITVI